MRLVFLGVCLGALVAGGQQPGAGPDAENVREQVAAGVLARNALDVLAMNSQHTRDQATLDLTLYSSVTVEEMTEEQADAMVEAARRLAAHSEQNWQSASRLVAEGVRPKSSLQAYEEDLHFRRKTLELAEQRASLFLELAEIVRAEEAMAKLENSKEGGGIAEGYDGQGVLRPSHLDAIRISFEKEFQRPLPVSARGDTALHRSLGFDHRGRMDVALHPDAPEGQWLIRKLEEFRIPYFAFRTDVAGKSTGAHIHLGPQSARLQRAD